MIIPELLDPKLNPPFNGDRQKKRANKIKNALRATTGCHCYICNDKLHLNDVTLDHVVPFSKGGRGKNNLMICCKRCNQYRATMPITYFKMLRGFVRSTHQILELKQFSPLNNGKSRLTKIIRDANSKV